MKKVPMILALSALLIAGCNNSENKKMNIQSTSDSLTSQDSSGAYASVNRLKNVFRNSRDRNSGINTRRWLYPSNNFWKVLSDFAKITKLLQSRCRLMDIQKILTDL
ncbi:MAG: hypothetical protein IPG90_08370 [Bacteroidetes bacterium]|nr:hypothetical protein [Bacteroidota bacterium]